MDLPGPDAPSMSSLCVPIHTRVMQTNQAFVAVLSAGAIMGISAVPCLHAWPFALFLWDPSDPSTTQSGGGTLLHMDTGMSTVKV